MVVFLQLFDNRCRILNFDRTKEYTGNDLKQYIVENECPSVLKDSLYLCHNGRILDSDTKILLDNGECWVSCHMRVPGGKGGFGSMLRAIGAQIEKTTNHEACRDLSGRRMRDVNDEKKITDWLSKQAERDEEKVRRKQERLEKLKSSPKHVFQDSSQYTSQLQGNCDSIEDALQKANDLKQPSSSLGKRKSDKKPTKRKPKKQRLWLGVDGDFSSDSDDDDGCSSSSVTSTSSVMGESDISTSNETDTSEPKAHHQAIVHTSNNEGNPSVDSTTSDYSSRSSPNSQETHTTKEQTIVEQTENMKPKEAKGEILPLNTTSIVQVEDVNLEDCQSAKELESLGLDLLKTSLIAKGVKCGGTLEQRAERLFAVKALSLDKIDPSLLAKPTTKKKKGKAI